MQIPEKPGVAAAHTLLNKGFGGLGGVQRAPKIPVKLRVCATGVADM